MRSLIFKLLHKISLPFYDSRDVAASDVLDFSGNTVYGDFRDDLVRDGYAVIKEAIPKERARQYVEQIQEYLESFGLGYDRNDPSTIHEDKLPQISEKGSAVSFARYIWIQLYSSILFTQC